MTQVLWQQLTAAELRERASLGAIVLLRVASTEQHGPYLATGVDDILCSEVCRRTALKLADKSVPVVVAPTMGIGLAEHHMAFGGSLTLTLPTYHALLHDLCGSILRAGFSRILIVNGHGGHMSALNALTVELTRELKVPIATTSYWGTVKLMPNGQSWRGRSRQVGSSYSTRATPVALRQVAEACSRAARYSLADIR